MWHSPCLPSAMGHEWGNGAVYDGRQGRPAAHLVIAWPHGVPVVDGMVDAFNSEGTMSVVSLVNAEMHNATELGACIYATEKSALQAQEIADKERSHRGRWIRAYTQKHILHKTVPRIDYHRRAYTFFPGSMTTPVVHAPWAGVSRAHQQQGRRRDGRCRHQACVPPAPRSHVAQRSHGRRKVAAA